MISKKITLILLALIFISIPLASAQTFPSEAQSTCETMKEQVAAQSNPKLPSYIPFSDEVVNMYFGDSEVIGFMILEEKKITSLLCKENDEPTYNIYIKDSQTLRDIDDSDSRLKTLVKKINADEIKIEGTSFGKKIKWFFAKAGMNVGAWFA